MTTIALDRPTQAITTVCDICGVHDDHDGLPTSRQALQTALERGWRRQKYEGCTIDLCRVCKHYPWDFR